MHRVDGCLILRTYGVFYLVVSIKLYSAGWWREFFGGHAGSALCASPDLPEQDHRMESYLGGLWYVDSRAGGVLGGQSKVRLDNSSVKIQSTLPYVVGHVT